MEQKPLILVVDDEESFREIFSIKLAAAGFRVETAENGEIALQKAKALKPDLILMDVRMPVLDGPSAVLKLYENPDTKNIRVAFLTSLGDPRLEMQHIDVKFSQDFGVQGYLRKTDDFDLLNDRIKAFLQ